MAPLGDKVPLVPSELLEEWAGTRLKGRALWHCYLKTVEGVPGRAQASAAPCPHPRPPQLPVHTRGPSGLGLGGQADRRQVRGGRAPASPSPSSVTP